MKECDSCHLDTVQIRDILRCTWQSVRDIYTEITSGDLSTQVFTTNDRMYYLIGLIIIGVSIRIWCQTLHISSEIEELWPYT